MKMIIRRALLLSMAACGLVLLIIKVTSPLAYLGAVIMFLGFLGYEFWRDKK